MAIWLHSICNYPINNPGEPVKCPHSVIPHCDDPTAGFDPIRSNVWECRSCGWLVIRSTAPSVCPSSSAVPCPSPETGIFEKVCD
jgi:hypothetical protein